MSEASERRLAQQRELTEARSQGLPPASSLPSPPFHLRGVTLLYLMCRFDPERVASVVPDGLRPSGSGWGIICFYSVARGWGIAPYEALYMTVELAGLDAPDTSPSNYMHSGIFTGVAGEVMTRTYNTNFRIGWSRLTVVDGVARGEAGIGDKTLIRASARIGATRDPISGAGRYIAKRPGGGFNSYAVAVSLGVKDTHDQSVEFLDDAGNWLNCLQPLEYVYPVLFEGDITITSPTLLTDAESGRTETREADLGAVFNRLGRPALILAKDGTVVSMNTGADDLLAAGRLRVTGRKIAWAQRRDADAFEKLLQGAVGRTADAVSQRIALSGQEGGLPLLAQAMSLYEDAAGSGRLLVTFDDPARRAETDTGPTLQLLGLTPAEARIASLVGIGQSPRETADALEISLNTVRSALKIIFDKLGISRQSELATIVARLAG